MEDWEQAWKEGELSKLCACLVGVIGGAWVLYGLCFAIAAQIAKNLSGQ